MPHWYRRYRDYTRSVLESRTSGGGYGYRALLAEHLHPGDRILHLGCGWDNSNVTRPYREQSEVIGVDLNRDAGPRYHSDFWLADAARLPFADASFDVICSEYVLEHVVEAEATLSEASRVLRRGGSFLILTPNLWSYKSIAALAIPQRLHGLAGRTLRSPSMSEEDMFPTLYRLNTVAKLKRLSLHADFEVGSIELLSNGPTWFQALPGVFELGRSFHWTIERAEWLRQLRCNIVARLVKSSGPEQRRDPLLIRCTQCGTDGMTASPGAYDCPSCAASYQRRANVTDTMSAGGS